MLVLSRKSGETVQIGQNIVVTLLGVSGQVAKIGIDAPRLIRILRGELCDGEGSEKRLKDGSGPGRVVLAVDY